MMVWVLMVLVMDLLLMLVQVVDDHQPGFEESSQL
jgi:hypothetical protein